MTYLTLLLISTVVLSSSATDKCDYSYGGYSNFNNGMQWMVGCYSCSCEYGQVSCAEATCVCPCGQAGICGGTQKLRCPRGSTCKNMEPPHYKNRIGKCCIKPDSCRFRGSVYPDGSKWKAGCYDCSCRQAAWTCTSGRCVPDRCVYKGKLYKYKERFTDDCNKCKCKKGSVECTKKLCGGCRYKGVSYPNGKTWTDGCIHCTCVYKKVKKVKYNCGCKYRNRMYKHGDAMGTRRKKSCCFCNNGKRRCARDYC